MKTIGWVLIVITIIAGICAVWVASSPELGILYRHPDPYMIGSWFFWLGILLLGIFLVRKGRQREREEQ